MLLCVTEVVIDLAAGEDSGPQSTQQSSGHHRYVAICHLGMVLVHNRTQCCARAFM